MRGTSLEAYESIRDDLQPKEMVVFGIIKMNQPCSNQHIAMALGWEINRVTGRTNSLVEKGVVIAYDKAKNEFGRSVIRWKIKLPPGTQETLF